jgi:dTDP-4-dehydrorhamnose reductase
LGDRARDQAIAGRELGEGHEDTEALLKILILGGDGMLGHQLLRTWGAASHRVLATLRRPLGAYAAYGLFTDANSVGEVEATDLDRVRALVDRFRPEAIVNCVGIVKQRSEAKAAIPSIEINSLLPHRLLDLCQESGIRLVHISTDCVFSGRTGNYRETDTPDPVDLYGRSKLLGEVAEAPGLTLRTSIIGLELSRFTGLIEWFLAQRGMIRGFRRAIYTGVTTRELARVIDHVLVKHPRLHGVWQVASAPISKYDLLSRLSGILGRTDIEIVADDDFACDRSLRSDAFAAETGYVAPSWDAMLRELADDIRARDAARADR